MRLLDLTLPTPAENLALDEALLEEAEALGEPAEVLRLWEPAQTIVVVGRSSNLAEEVDVDICRRDGVPVLRRASGGSAVVTGPGCLMYAVVLSYRLRPHLRAVDHAHRFVLGTIADALRPVVPTIGCQGTSDLVVGICSATGDDCAADAVPRDAAASAEQSQLLKCSGNSVRCKREHLLYHGTLLYGLPLELVERYLPMPPRQPEYRGSRPHGAFLANLPIAPDAIRRALRDAWDACEPYGKWPRERTARLVAEKFSRPEWNERR
jgi:lipoate-protein ligase A